MEIWQIQLPPVLSDVVGNSIKFLVLLIGRGWVQQFLSRLFVPSDEAESVNLRQKRQEEMPSKLFSFLGKKIK
jgi:hypothetical protein